MATLYPHFLHHVSMHCRRLIVIPVVMLSPVPVMMATSVRSRVSAPMVANPRIPMRFIMHAEMTAAMGVMVPTTMPVMLPVVAPFVVFPVIITTR